MKQKNKKILIVNTNRYRHPPVLPLGIEYLVHSLSKNSFEVEILDLCFSDAPLKGLAYAINNIQPDAVCMTIRNLDSALFPGTDYFLPEIKEYIKRIRSLTDSPILIGGSALSADPQGILNFVGADIAIEGPGEVTLPVILKEANIFRKKGRVIKGIPPESFCPQRVGGLSYQDYLEQDGLPGFETHKGCSSNCAYCMEACTPVSFRKPEDVVCELRQLAEQGFKHLHLCDSEFNEDVDYCCTLLEKIKKEKLGLKWGLYMMPGNYSKRLFELLHKTGAYLVTLSVDTLSRDAQYWEDVETMVSFCRKTGLKVSIDFLTGFPYEKNETLSKSLDFFRRIAPEEVVVNVFLRLYKGITITRTIEKDPSLKEFLIGSEGHDSSMLSPVFYNHIPVEKLQALINNDPLFRIAGAEKVVNYQKNLDFLL